ncbi:hypothetical protein L596_003860 [Steinernema carpocapsae]|uniref:Uncharacterized protein n=1 Tax=Steinernema carpocapsae TaxID=34508 RepID=A0A4U8UVI3_STECR|nr:hypothetical protein L596_003860 [Steinernema carpocapsae]
MARWSQAVRFCRTGLLLVLALTVQNVRSQCCFVVNTPSKLLIYNAASAYLSVPPEAVINGSQLQNAQAPWMPLDQKPWAESRKAYYDQASQNGNLRGNDEQRIYPVKASGRQSVSSQPPFLLGGSQTAEPSSPPKGFYTREPPRFLFSSTPAPYDQNPQSPPPFYQPVPVQFGQGNPGDRPQFNPPPASNSDSFQDSSDRFGGTSYNLPSENHQQNGSVPVFIPVVSSPASNNPTDKNSQAPFVYDQGPSGQQFPTNPNQATPGHQHPAEQKALSYNNPSVQFPYQPQPVPQWQQVTSQNAGQSYISPNSYHHDSSSYAAEQGSQVKSPTPELMPQQERNSQDQPPQQPHLSSQYGNGPNSYNEPSVQHYEGQPIGAFVAPLPRQQDLADANPAQARPSLNQGSQGQPYPSAHTLNGGYYSQDPKTQNQQFMTPNPYHNDNSGYENTLIPTGPLSDVSEGRSPSATQFQSSAQSTMPIQFGYSEQTFSYTESTEPPKRNQANPSSQVQSDHTLYKDNTSNMPVSHPGYEGYPYVADSQTYQEGESPTSSYPQSSMSSSPNTGTTPYFSSTPQESVSSFSPSSLLVTDNSGQPYNSPQRPLLLSKSTSTTSDNQQSGGFPGNSPQMDQSSSRGSNFLYPYNSEGNYNRDGQPQGARGEQFVHGSALPSCVAGSVIAVTLFLNVF